MSCQGFVAAAQSVQWDDVRLFPLYLFGMKFQKNIYVEIAWRIIPFSRWLKPMVIVSPLSRVIPLPNGLFMAYKLGVILTTYVRPEMILQVAQKSMNRSYESPRKMGVSKNRGTPKSSILIGFSIIFTIHFGVSLFLETPKWL